MLLFCLVFSQLQAAPLIFPGDVALRHHLSILADAGVIRTPVTTWPLTLPNIQIDLESSRMQNTPYRVSINYLKFFGRQSSSMTQHIGAGLANQPLGYSQFGLPNRPLRQIFWGASVARQRWHIGINASLYERDTDDYSLRLDGSYAIFGLGNWLIGVDKIPRWWGPGWDGSLIYSNNVEPIPTFGIRRAAAMRFANRLLHWLGPWQLSVNMGQLERQRVVPGALLFSSRLSFKPTTDFEFALFRSAQWAGRGRPRDMQTFLRLLLGLDNVGESGVDLNNQPGNQLAGMDMRWVSPLWRKPYAFYAQGVGEDEAGGLPIHFIGLFGLEWWRDAFRIYTEYADTRARFVHHDPAYNLAYEHSVYRSGYRYRGRSIGHTLDNDSKMWSFGFIRVYPSGAWWQMLLRRIRPDVDAGRVEQYNLGLVSAMTLANNKISLGWQWTWHQAVPETDHDDSQLAYVKWTRSF